MSWKKSSIQENVRYFYLFFRYSTIIQYCHIDSPVDFIQNDGFIHYLKATIVIVKNRASSFLDVQICGGDTLVMQSTSTL